MEESCKRSSETERRAEKAERALVKLKLLQYVSTQIGMEFDAIITGVQHFGLFCQGIDIPIEGLLPLEGLADRELFDYDEKTLTLTGRRSGQVFRLGDAIRVSVAKVDLERRELDLELVSHQPSINIKAASGSRDGRKKERKGPKKGFRIESRRKTGTSQSGKPGGDKKKRPKQRGPAKGRRRRK
ncbi:MAG: S1 RNA-binding domain-containing protein [Planctomycetaceae bacterium]